MNPTRKSIEIIPPDRQSARTYLRDPGGFLKQAAGVARRSVLASRMGPPLRAAKRHYGLIRSLKSTLLWPFHDYWLRPPPITVTIRRYAHFYKDLRGYFELPGAEPFDIRWMIPLIHDKYSDAGDTGQYFYQDIWAMKRIMETKASSHVDVGSRMIFVGMMSAMTRVTYVDVRPLQCSLPNLESRIGDITTMPYPDSSVRSLSCLHVAEHIGLGRYGDKLDPKGTEKAAAELVRVLAPSGNLFFSVPVGNPERVYFNSHRMYSVSTIMAMFSDLELVEVSGVDGGGTFIENIDVRLFDDVKHQSGGVCLLWLRKPAEVGRQ
jgi:Caenorhabditis protein of unknown function, DUF268